MVDEPQNPFEAPNTVAAANDWQAENDPIRHAKAKLRGPATALLSLSATASVFGVIGTVANVMNGVSPILPLAYALLMIFQSICAGQMGSLKSIRLAYVGAILGCIPLLTPFVWFGIPFALWALVVLGTRQVQSAFEIAKLPELEQHMLHGE